MLAQIDAATIAENTGRVATLFVPTAIGWVLSRAKFMASDDSTVAGINAFVLLACFPALIAVSVIDIDPGQVAGWGFWALTPLVLAVGVAISRATGAIGVGPVAGTTALITLFGNTAFLGIPYVVAVFGPQARGPAAVSVAMQVSIGVALGPALLQRWSGPGDGAIAWRRLFTQPLFWSPFIGLALRALPDAATDSSRTALGPLGTAAAPTAMFVLGTYLARPASQRATARRSGVTVGIIVRLLVAPAAALGVASLLVALDALSPEVAAIIVVLTACPAAVTTFPLAQNEGVEPATVASIVVISSVVSLGTLPLWATFAAALF